MPIYITLVRLRQNHDKFVLFNTTLPYSSIDYQTFIELRLIKARSAMFLDLHINCIKCFLKRQKLDAKHPFILHASDDGQLNCIFPSCCTSGTATSISTFTDVVNERGVDYTNCASIFDFDLYSLAIFQNS